MMEHVKAMRDWRYFSLVDETMSAVVSAMVLHAAIPFCRKTFGQFPAVLLLGAANHGPRVNCADGPTKYLRRIRSVELMATVFTWPRIKNHVATLSSDVKGPGALLRVLQAPPMIAAEVLVA